MDMKVFLLLACLAYVSCEVKDLSCDEIKQFVDGHNARRQAISEGKVLGQPAATQMKLMVWDEELEDKASEWASRNEFTHNPDREIPSGRFSTGENIFMFSSSDRHAKLNIDSALESWFSENVNYTFGPIKDSRYEVGQPKTGHYTQMVWSDTKYVGCAVSEYFDGWKNFLVVCEYGPTGNYVDKVPYPAGKPGNGLICESKEECDHNYGPSCLDS